MKILLDTNVLIDYFALRPPYADDAIKLRIAEYFGDVEWWASAHSYLDILYIMRKAAGTTAIREALFESLDFVHLANVDEQGIRMALSSDWKDVEDCVIANCANNVDVDYLVTRNKEDYLASNISCVTPSELLSVLKRDHGLSFDEIDFPQ